MLRMKQDKSEICFVSICTNDYLHFGIAWAESVASQYGDVGIVLFVDGLDKEIKINNVTVLDVSSLNEDVVPWLRLKYSPLDFCCALKPYVVLALLNYYKKVIYSDCDIYYFSYSEELISSLNNNKFFVTPHLLDYITENNYKSRPTTGDIYYSGLLNAGLFGVLRDEETYSFLLKWKEQVTRPGAFMKALGGMMEQQLFNWVLIFLSNYSIIKNKTINVAYWNLHERTLRWGGLDSEEQRFLWYIDGGLIGCFHFSSFPFRKNSFFISEHDHRNNILNNPSLEALQSFYSDILEKVISRYQLDLTYRYKYTFSGCRIRNEIKEYVRDNELSFPVKYNVWDLEQEVLFFKEMLSPAFEYGSLIPRVFYYIYKRTNLSVVFENSDVTPDYFWPWICRFGIKEFGMQNVYNLVKPAILTRSGYEKLLSVLPEGTDILRFCSDNDYNKHIVQELSFDSSDKKYIEERCYEKYCYSDIEFIYSTYLHRQDLQCTFPRPLDKDRESFISWLYTYGIPEENISEQKISTFIDRGNIGAVIRIFSYITRTLEFSEQFADSLMESSCRNQFYQSLISLSQNNLEFTLEDIMTLKWYMELYPQELVYFYVNLTTNIRKNPSTKTLPGIQSLMGKPYAQKVKEGVESIIANFNFNEHLESNYISQFNQELNAHSVTTWKRQNSSASSLYRKAVLSAETNFVDNHNIKTYSNGINFFGFFSSDIGLGTMSQNTWKCLNEINVPTNKMFVGNVSLRNNAKVSDVITNFDYSYSTNIFVSYPHFQYDLFEFYPKWYTKHRHNITYLAWEQRDASSFWKDVYCKYDQVWALSSFAATSLQNVLKRSVYPVPCPLDVSSFPLAVSKESLKLPNDKFVLLFIFDANSSAERKNPLGVLRALSSIPNYLNDILLVIKANNITKAENRELYLELVSYAAAQNINYILLDSYTDYSNILNLISACDCYISLHRAEGFGYTCAEAMAYEKPVIATNYSGNLDFMDTNSSCLVDYTEITLDKNCGPFQRGSIWADPSFEQAGAYIAKLFDDAQLRVTLGQKARNKVEQTLSIPVISHKINQLLSSLWSNPCEPSGFPE